MEQVNSFKSRKNGKRDFLCKKIIEYGILGLIIFSPLPAASVYEWSILVIQLVVLVMMIAYFIMEERSKNNEVISHSLKWPKYLFISLFILIFIQIIPLPSFLVKIFSSNTYTYLKNFSPDFENIKFMSLSIIPSHTLYEGLELLSYFLLGFLIVKTVKERRQIMKIFYVLFAIGIFEAFYGLVELNRTNPRILFFAKIYNLDSVTGTFINRNHLSGYLEMILPLAIGIMIARINFFSFSGLRWREKLLMLSEKNFSTNLLIFLGIIIIAMGIVFSKSRSGVFILVFTFMLMFELTVLFFRRSETGRKWIKSFLVISFLFITIISLYIGIGATFERFSLNKLLSENRPVYWANTIGIFKDFPVFGSGLGTFPSLYPDREEGGKIVRLFHAHNDYLEYLSEIGVIGMILLLGGVFFVLVKSFIVWRERRYHEIKGISLGGIVAIFCILLHSITDFNLHIPANMLLFSVVLSLTYVTVFYKKKGKNSNNF